MAGFLRKKATFLRKSAVRDTLLPSPVYSPERLSFDTPPSLPPLIVNPSLADPDPASNPPPSLPPAASPPVVGLPTPATAYLTPDEDWNPWKAYSNAPSIPRVDSQTRANVTIHSRPVETYAPQPLRDHITPPIPNSRVQPLLPGTAEPQSIKLSASNASSDAATTYYTAVSRPSPVVTEHSQRKQIARDLGEERALPPIVPPKGEVLGNQPLTQKPKSVSANVNRPSNPTAVVRGQTPLSSNFDFEESLSAANVTSVVNQFRSRPPPTHNHVSPPPTSQDPQTVIEHPQTLNDHRQPSLKKKSGSSSSLSSSSHHTDVTRMTNGSYGTSTSASSIPPLTEVIDVSERLDLVGPPSTSHSGLASNVSSPSGIGSPRSPSISQPGPNPASRVFATNTGASGVQRPSTASSVPPTSYSERLRGLARQASVASFASTPESSESYSRSPMLFDALRSAGSELAGQFRRGPLIFNASPTSPLPYGADKPPVPSPLTVQNAYPSPPAEYASLEPPRRSRSASISSSFHRTSSAGTPPHDASEFSRQHKSSKSSLSAARRTIERTTSAGGRGDVGSESFKSRVLTKARPTTPQKPSTPSHKVLADPGDSLLLDDDPFARIEGVRMLKPRARTPSNGEKDLPNVSGECNLKEEDVARSEEGHRPKTPSTPPPALPNLPPTPVSPDDYKAARQQRRGQWLERAPPPAVADVIAKQRSMHDEGVQAEEQQADDEQPREPSPPPTYFPVVSFMSDANLLPLLLAYLTYPEWLALYSANKQIRELFQSRILREFVLERYLGTVGYSKWNFEWAEPLPLSLKDLNNYLRGVSMPVHQYARLAAAYLQPKASNREDPSASDGPDILSLALTTRAYTRVVLRLRAQAESEARYLRTLQSAEANQNTSPSRPGTRQPSVSSRAPSPSSSYSHSRNHSHGRSEIQRIQGSSTSATFRSPLLKLGRAPVLRVFVPSPDGGWLSDTSVLECEAELKRSGVLKLLRVGDVVWDVAVGDEGNLGRMMWDGSYLVDLDYRYSRVGEISPYFHSLAFSPSYFHRAIRIGGSATHNPHCNPIVYLDVSPWGREIATNLQLLQDRARTETPHGAFHDVVRWVHRSTFTIRPPVPPPHAQAYSLPRALRAPIPNVEGFFIDPGWYGTVVVEAQGTNEGLADLQERCGPGVFPPRAENLASKMRGEREKEGRRVWRILREKSRPGEIWLRAVEAKERVM